MIARLTMLMFVAMAVAAALIGCGGGGDDGGGEAAGAAATSSLSEAEFAKQANAACRKEKANLYNEVIAYTGKHQRAGKPEEDLHADLFEAVLLPTMEAELAQLRKLGIPADNGAGVEAFLDAEQAAIDAAADLTTGEAKAEVERRFATAARLARGAGIPQCANAAEFPR